VSRSVACWQRGIGVVYLPEAVSLGCTILDFAWPRDGKRLAIARAAIVNDFVLSTGILKRAWVEIQYSISYKPASCGNAGSHVRRLLRQDESRLKRYRQYQEHLNW
jgi:hypothetical protein